MDSREAGPMVSDTKDGIARVAQREARRLRWRHMLVVGLSYAGMALALGAMVWTFLSGHGSSGFSRSDIPIAAAAAAAYALAGLVASYGLSAFDRRAAMRSYPLVLVFSFVLLIFLAVIAWGESTGTTDTPGRHRFPGERLLRRRRSTAGACEPGGQPAGLEPPGLAAAGQTESGGAGPSVSSTSQNLACALIDMDAAAAVVGCPVHAPEPQGSWFLRGGSMCHCYPTHGKGFIQLRVSEREDGARAADHKTGSLRHDRVPALGDAAFAEKYGLNIYSGRWTISLRVMGRGKLDPPTRHALVELGRRVVARLPGEGQAAPEEAVTATERLVGAARWIRDR